MYHSTTHAGKVRAFIEFCLALVTHGTCRTRINARSWACSNDLTRMRSLLNQLGLTGEAFTTARLHMTSLLKEQDQKEKNKREAA